MLVRGFVAVSLAGGSALTKKFRPVSSDTFAICALAPAAKKVAANAAPSASVARISRVLLAVRSIIHALRKANCAFGAYYSTPSFQQERVLVNVPFVLVPPPG